MAGERKRTGSVNLWPSFGGTLPSEPFQWLFWTAWGGLPSRPGVWPKQCSGRMVILRPGGVLRLVEDKLEQAQKLACSCPALLVIIPGCCPTTPIVL